MVSENNHKILLTAKIGCGKMYESENKELAEFNQEFMESLSAEQKAINSVYCEFLLSDETNWEIFKKKVQNSLDVV